MRYLAILTLFIFSYSSAQEVFRNPLDIPMFLSGSFAELRSNHYHSGIDIKTNEKTGYPVYAVQEGWVSRIKVSPWGFGYAIYINHESGYTSVYAHLDAFNEKISTLILEEQYKKKTFSIDLYFTKNKMPISGSEIIGFTGDSGSSGGPHLHFELRDQANQKPINPLNFNFDILDQIKPEFKKIVVYNNEEKSFYDVKTKDSGSYFIDMVEVNGPFNLGIITRDISDFSKNPLGINKVELYKNDIIIYKYDNQKFSFSESRYINSQIDYKTYKTTKKRIQKLFVEPGNKLSSNSKKLDVIVLEPNKTYNFKVLIYDSENNKSQLSFKAKLENGNHRIENGNEGERWAYNTEHWFENEDLALFIKKGSLYKDCYFNFQFSENDNYLGKKIFSIGDENIPLHKSMKISFKIPQPLHQYKSKLVVVNVGKNGFEGLSTKLDGDFLSVNTKNFGKYAIHIDTIPPSISLIRNDFKTTKEQIAFKVYDELSGISSYNGLIDGKWVLLKYDPKRKMMFYDIDKYLIRLNKKRTFTLVVLDGKGIKNEKTLEFYY